MKRQVSWVLGVLGAVGPFAWARLALASVYSHQGEGGHYICGLPALVILWAASVGTMVLSGTALVFGLLALRAIPSPRPPTRVVEVFMLALPLLPAGLYLAFLFLFS